MRKFLLFAAMFMAGTVIAHADELSDIKSRGVLVCGVFSGAEPFAFQDPASRELRGYDIDVCKAVATRLGVKPEFKVVSLDARIPELQQGRVDILAAVLGYTAARAEQVSFSDTYFVSQMKIAVLRQDGFKSVANLAGKRVGAVRGSSAIAFLRNALPGATVVTYEDAPSGYMALAQGKVSGFAATDVSLHRFAHKLGASTPIDVLEPAVGSEYWGLGIRKGEPAFEKTVNATLQAMDKSGEVDTIFNRWMGAGTEYQMKRSFSVAPIPQK
ncbi:ABC transporter substrate-binding protein [Paraburkholderia fungorum]|uniref:Cysteine ABC transporter substrate-binding protein n=1 Tax=Paraburkholderia fungorum TaxID=134537 RepID=A0A420FNA4_9BURK|nr:ABC transporter substrate-binding protein [Paraburkholderia fungorum]RKF34431.1 cysteine ABC transporter substrate-binding protein [Paraburkholderia fungorum]